uniref:Uncharacterized protein n=1 Tax=Vitis vinifera TaxID=29760 RepID=A5AI66_VITVI|nr:hypothetical protein VITISV_021313 [Vitis vinifera]
MIGGLQGEFGDLDIKYLKQNISKCRSEISRSLRKNSVALCKMAAKLSGSGEGETSSSPIWRQAPDVKYPDKVESRKGDRLCVQGVGTPTPDDTELASLSGATPSGFPKRTRGALPYPYSLREKNTALVNITRR